MLSVIDTGTTSPFTLIKEQENYVYRRVIDTGTLTLTEYQESQYH